jgi:hypothetical protein
MVGMTVVWGIAEHNFGLAPPDDFNDFQEVFLGVLKKTIGHAQIFPEDGPHFQCRRCCFSIPQCCTAPAPQFATGEVKQADRFALVNMLQQTATTAQFNIIWMDANGEDINFHRLRIIQANLICKSLLINVL